VASEYPLSGPPVEIAANGSFPDRSQRGESTHSGNHRRGDDGRFAFHLPNMEHPPGGMEKGSESRTT
jgi:hypothetical protein